MRSTRASWWRGQDLNLRPSGYEPDELPDCSTPQQGTTIMGFWRFLCNLRYPKELIPSPPGRRGVKRRPFFCAKRRMRVRVRVRLHSVVRCRHLASAYPHPPLRGTLSRRERDLVWLFPSPSGRRWREAPDEGSGTRAAALHGGLQTLRACVPSPAPAGHPLPEGEGK